MRRADSAAGHWWHNHGLWLRSILSPAKSSLQGAGYFCEALLNLLRPLLKPLLKALLKPLGFPFWVPARGHVLWLKPLCFPFCGPASGQVLLPLLAPVLVFFWLCRRLLA